LTNPKSPDEIDRIRASCRIVFAVQQEIEKAIVPGATSLELDRLAETVIRDHGAIPAFKGYHDFPASICASPNAEAVHGFPNNQPLCDGDILSVDVGVLLDGYFGDGAFTIGIGTVPAPVQRLLQITRACLEDGIDQARPGRRLTDISHAIQTRAENAGLAVVRDFGGHGIGRALHEDPHIPNYGPPGKGLRLQAGLVLAIEPILSLGSPRVKVGEDGWTTTTTDGAAAAHFEHTVAITPDGPEILTLPPPSAQKSS
jgi:methionyl aminopeptidase